MTKSNFNFSDYDSHLDKALFVRSVEEALLELFAAGKVSGTVHTCIGQELIGVVVADKLSSSDIIFSNHRGHGHYISATGDYYGLIAEIMGRSFGAAGGIGGSQHLYNKNYYSNGIQGSTLPVSAGCAFANKIEANNGISVSFIGDGTLGEGIVYETLNIASLWQLPLLIVIENNRISQTTDTRQNLAGSIEKRAEAFNIKYFSADTYHIDNLDSKVQESMDHVRLTKSPAIIEIQTDRLRSHSKGDDNRDPQVIKEYYKRDLLSKYLLTNEGASKYQAAQSVVAETIRDIEAQDEVFSPVRGTSATKKVEFEEIGNIKSGIRINDQIYTGLKNALDADSKVILLGEDIENNNSYNPVPYGGAFKVTRDLSNVFPNRVLNTPISEAAIVGIANGLALRGMKPVVEIMFGDFLPLAFDQLINNSAKFVEMFGKRLDIPLLLRVPMGARRGYGPTHSQTLEKHFLGIKNLDMLALNHRIDNAKLVETLICNIKNPTILIENKVLYTKFSNEDKIPGFSYYSTTSPYPDVLIEPKGIDPDFLIICHGQMLEEVEKAVSVLSLEDEVYCSIFCLCNISDPNIDALEKLSNKIKGVLVVEEGSDIGGISSEIIMRMMENQSFDMKSVVRFGNREIIPCSKEGEDKVIPNQKSIRSLIKKELRNG